MYFSAIFVNFTIPLLFWNQLECVLVHQSRKIDHIGNQDGVCVAKCCNPECSQSGPHHQRVAQAGPNHHGGSEAGLHHRGGSQAGPCHQGGSQVGTYHRGGSHDGTHH